jgi:hypothetical protein
MSETGETRDAPCNGSLAELLLWGRTSLRMVGLEWSRPQEGMQPSPREVFMGSFHCISRKVPQ